MSTRLSARTSVAAAALLLATASVHAQSSEEPAPTLPNVAVDSVDLERYAGKWYEQARLPQSFQSQCVADTTAEYALNTDGTVAVTNRCRTEDGSFDESQGVARRVDGSTSRTPQLDDGIREQLIARAAAMGYSVGKVVETPQG